MRCWRSQQTLPGRRQVACEEAGLSISTRLAGVHELCLSRQCFIRFRSQSLGNVGLVLEVKSCVWTLAMAGLRGRLTAKVSREILDPLAGGRLRSFTENGHGI